MHFGQFLKACANNNFAQIAPFWQFFVKVAKSFILLVKSFWGNFYFWSSLMRLFSLLDRYVMYEAWYVTAYATMYAVRSSA